LRVCGGATGVGDFVEGGHYTVASLLHLSAIV